MIDPTQAALGVVVLLIVVGALVWLVYSRTNAVEKTGYGALIMLAIVSLMIPTFWILESNAQTASQVSQHNNAVAQGAALYAKYCQTCHGLNGQGLVGPKLNNNAVVNGFSDANLLRIIEAGIPANSSDPTTLAMPAWSDQYGGPLSDPQIQYLFALIRSSDPAYLKKNAFPTGSNADGFSQVPGILQQTQPSAFQTASAQATSFAGTGQFGTATDETNVSSLTIDITTTAPNNLTACNPGCFNMPNVKVKVGTVLTFVNKTTVAHTVSAIKGLDPGNPVINSALFDKPIAPGATITITVTEAMLNANQNHQLIYYCSYHPSMVAMLTIVPA